MPREIYYHRKDLSSATETTFFDTSRAEATNKEIDTNMPMAYKVGKSVTIKKIVVQLPTVVASSSTAADTTVLDNLKTIIEEGVIVLQVGDGRIYYLPLVYALPKSQVSAVAQYTQGTAADATFAIASAQSITDGYGLDVEIPWGAEDELKFTIKTKTAVTLSNVKVVLECEVAA